MKDYEKKYKEALERAKKYKLKEDLIITQDIFPELCESEDEKIRKALIEHFRWNVQQILNDFDNKDVLAWLEKQGVQNLEWSKEENDKISNIIAWIKDYPRLAKFKEEAFVKANSYADWLKSLRPQNRWKPSKELLDVFIKNATDFFESNFNPLTDSGVIGAFDDKEKMIEEFKEYMKEEGFNEEWI